MELHEARIAPRPPEIEDHNLSLEVCKVPRVAIGPKAQYQRGGCFSRLDPFPLGKFCRQGEGMDTFVSIVVSPLLGSMATTNLSACIWVFGNAGATLERRGDRLTYCSRQVRKDSSIH